MNTKKAMLVVSVIFIILSSIVALFAFFEDGILISNPEYWLTLAFFLFMSALFLYFFFKERQAEKRHEQEEKKRWAEFRKKYDFDFLFTNVAGVTFGDAQQVLPNLCAGMDLQFIREPDNQYDTNAIRVECCGSVLGHIKADVAAKLAPKIDSGKAIIKGNIADITGGFAPGVKYGCKMKIVIYTKKQEDITTWK